MPIYEYECKSCYARFEVKQSIADEPIKVCPTCQGVVRRVLHPVGIVFKGTGFYTTDHGRGRSNGGPRSDEPSSKPEASKKDEKKDPAHATTGETKTGS